MGYFNRNNNENTIVKDHTDDQQEVTRLETKEKIESQEENFDDCLKSDQVEKVSEAQEDTEENFDDAVKDTNQYEKTAEAAEEDNFDTSDLEKGEDTSETAEDEEESFDDAVEDTDQKQEDTSETAEDTSDTTEDTSETAEDTSDTTEDTSDTTEDTTETTEDTSDATEDTTETTEDTSDTTEDTTETTEDTSEATEDTADTTEDTSDADTGDARDPYKEINQDQMEETPETEEKTDETSEDIKEEDEKTSEEENSNAFEPVDETGAQTASAFESIDESKEDTETDSESAFETVKETEDDQTSEAFESTDETGAQTASAFESIDESGEQTESNPEDAFEPAGETGAQSASAFESVDGRRENTENTPEAAFESAGETGAESAGAFESINETEEKGAEAFESADEAGAEGEEAFESADETGAQSAAAFESVDESGQNSENTPETAFESAEETSAEPAEAFESIKETEDQGTEAFESEEETGAKNTDAFESVDENNEGTETNAEEKAEGSVEGSEEGPEEKGDSEQTETAETEGKGAVEESQEISEKGSEEDTEQDSEKNAEDTEEKPEDIEKDPEDIEENPEDTEKDPEDIEENPEDTEKDPEDTEKDSEDTEANPEETEKNPEDTEENPEDTEKDPEDTEANPEDTEKDSEDTEANPEETEKNPEDTEENPEDTEKDPEDTEENPEDTEANPEDTEKDSEDTEANPEETEKNPEDTEENPEDTEKDPEDTEENPEDTEANPEDTEKDSEDTEENPEETEENPEDTEKDPEETEENPEETEENPEDTEENPEETEENPEDTEKNPEETEEDSEKNPEETEENPEKKEDTEDTDEDTDEGDSSSEGGTEVTPETDEELQEYRKETDESRRESNTETPKPAFASIDEVSDQKEETGEKRDLEGREEENAEQQEKTIEQKIEDIRDMDGVSLSYLSDLKNENAMELAAVKQEYEGQKQQAINIYSEMLDGHVSPERMAELKEEYQNLRGEIGRTGSRIDALESSGDAIDSKIDETRDAMIADGWEASRNTELAGQLAEGLHDEYNEIYYDSKASEADLTDLAERNKGLIEEMTSEKDRIEQAKEAKMSQIREYVCSNDMERYDTERDPHYQSLIAEYRELEEAGKRLDYPIANLDEDTKLISDRLNVPYESVQRSERIVPLVQECGHGVDDPEKTNYFVDETKAREALEPFADQESWEKMDLEAKTEKLEALRDYIGEVFGDKDKPEIVYYHGDANSYGSYIDSANVIKINVDNINDSSEIMDTVAHEYRHRYQSMRAQALENTRDVEYKRGLDPENYIVYDPDRGLNDFEGYKNQLVETDARAFAQSFKDKLEEMRSSDRTLAEVKDTSPEETRKESGIVFDETDDEGGMLKVQETGEIGKQEEGKETREGTEGLTVEEISAIKDRVAPRYENCAQIASQIESLENYKEHTELENGHIEKVYNKSMEAADTLKEVFEENSYDGYYSPDVDKRALGAMAWYHDTGMDGAVQARDYESGKAAYTESRLEEEIARRQAANESGEGSLLSLEPEEIRKDLEKEYDNHFRKEHQFYSAVHVLEDREFLESQGINADEVAFGCMLHSKSGSGVRELSDTESWDGAISKLQTRIDAYNETHETKIRFDDTFIREKSPDGEGFVYKQEEAARVRTECACLRLGDANGHDFESGTTQAGHSLNAEYQSEYLENNPGSDLLDQEADKTHYHTTKLKAEVQESSVQNDAQEIDKGDLMGRMYALGERNFKEIGTRTENAEVVEYVNLVEGDHYTHATQECILERIKELQSITVPDTAAGKTRGMEKPKARPIDHHVEIDLGDVHNQETLDSYKAFKARIFRQYHVRVKVTYNDLTGKNKR